VASAAAGYSAKIVNNSRPDDQHTIYHIKVVSPDNGEWEVTKRYREFRELHDHLKMHVPESTLPPLPGKRLFLSSIDPNFVAKRQGDLQQYLDGLLALRQFPPDLRAFLGVSARQKGYEKRADAKKYVDLLHKKLLNISAPPSQLEEAEMNERVEKYSRAMKLNVFSQPVDPINLRQPGFDAENIPVVAMSPEEHDTLKQPSAGSVLADKAKAMDAVLDKLQEALRTNRKWVEPQLLIIEFPTFTSGGGDKGVTEVPGDP